MGALYFISQLLVVVTCFNHGYHPVFLTSQDFQWPTVGPLDRADLAVACPASGRRRARPEIEAAQGPCEAQGTGTPQGWGTIGQDLWDQSLIPRMK
jgi:hypothetical protein